MGCRKGPVGGGRDSQRPLFQYCHEGLLLEARTNKYKMRVDEVPVPPKTMRCLNLCG